MDPLYKLAHMAGISDSYIDKTGVSHETNDRVRRFFLKAMGYCVDTKEDICRQIQLLEKESALPEVLSFFEGEKIEFKFDLFGSSYVEIFDESGRKIYTREITENEKVQISNIPFGYYTIKLQNTLLKKEILLIHAPKQAYKPFFLENGEHIYGVAVMLYALHSKHNIGIGDFGDLEEIIKASAKVGADVVGVNPLGVMSLYTQNEERFDYNARSDVSPYRTLSRLFINYVYIDLSSRWEFQAQSVQDFFNSDKIQQEISELNDAEEVQYARVLSLKLKFLTLMFEEFCRNASKKEKMAFENYKKLKGQEVDNLALFETLLETLYSQDYWRHWSNNYNDIHSTETKHFVAQHKTRLEFYRYIHFLADKQLADLQNLAKSLGMKVGLYTDMPIGAASNGVEVWENPSAYVLDADIGAPADPMRPRGQSWGFTPYHPLEIKKQHYKPFISLVEQNMKYSGALRIDHAMGLQRLFWGYFNDESPAVQGAYIYYEMKDLVAILNLESHRAKCMVICEDLGTVPAGFREYMKEHDLLSYKVMSRQKEKDESFIAPEKYDYMSLAQFSTHDQATSLGFWKNEDINTFNKCGLYITDEQYHQNLEGRKQDRYQLINALKDQKIISEAQKNDMLQKASDGSMAPQNLNIMLNEYVSKTNSALYLVRLNDIYGQIRLDNAPGTVRQYPNWRIKMPVQTNEIASSEAFQNTMRTIKGARPQKKKS